jgi:phosphomevalonate kinase
VPMTRSSQMIRVSAPGKMMISGEYAVLEGAEAIVAAVDRRAYASLSPSAPPPAPEVLAAFREAQARGGPLQGGIALDVAEMRSDGMKIGLGSSAAGAAAAAGLVFASQGKDPQASETRREILAAALAGHRAVSPKGSGADVAASVHGGFLRFRRLGDTPDAIETFALEWPSAVEVRVVWTGQEARTSDFVAKVDQLASSAPARHRQVLAHLGSEADAFVSAVIARDVAGIIESTDAYGSAMNELGIAAGINIVTDALAEIAELANAAGGAAKPSGAGGGDVALCIFPSQASAERFERACARVGLRLLSIKLGVPGVRVETPARSTGEAA